VCHVLDVASRVRLINKFVIKVEAGSVSESVSAVTVKALFYRSVFSSATKTQSIFCPFTSHTPRRYGINYTGQQIKKIVSVMNMLLIYLFASMKLEKGHKKLLDSSFKIMPLL